MADAPAFSSSPDLLPVGSVLKDTYEIVRYLGEGGAGCVYLAEHTGLGHYVAIKTLYGRFVRDNSMRERFLEEGIIQANLKHKNIVQVHDRVDEPGFCAFIMEYVGGSSLDRYLRDRPPTIDIADMTRLFCEVLEGASYAHARSVVHRDIKPANILLSVEEGVVTPKLTDFGIAKILSGQRHTETGTAMGTIYYAPPEQLVDARSVDHRADVYALGCTFFEMLSGRVPFDGATVFNIMKQHIEAPRPDVCSLNPAVSQGLSVTLRKAMAIDPAQRFQSASEFREAVLSVVRNSALRVTDIAHAAATDPVSPANTEQRAGPIGTDLLSGTTATAAHPRVTLPGDPLAATQAEGRPSSSLSNQTPQTRPTRTGARTPVPTPNRTPTRIINGIIITLALVVLAGIWVAISSKGEQTARTEQTTVSAASAQATATATNTTPPAVAPAHAVPPHAPDTGGAVSPNAVPLRSLLTDCRILTTRYSPYIAANGISLGDAIAELEDRAEPCRSAFIGVSDGTLMATTRVDTDASRIHLSLLELRALSAQQSALSPCSHAESAARQSLGRLRALTDMAADPALEPHHVSELQSYSLDLQSRYIRVHAANVSCAIAPLPPELAPADYVPPVNPNIIIEAPADKDGSAAP